VVNGTDGQRLQASPLRDTPRDKRPMPARFSVSLEILGHHHLLSVQMPEVTLFPARIEQRGS